MLKIGDRFEWNGIKYVVLDVIFSDDGIYYKVKGECGAIKIYPSIIENKAPLYKRL